MITIINNCNNINTKNKITALVVIISNNNNKNNNNINNYIKNNYNNNTNNNRLDILSNNNNNYARSAVSIPLTIANRQINALNDNFRL